MREIAMHHLTWEIALVVALALLAFTVVMFFHLIAVPPKMEHEQQDRFDKAVQEASNREQALKDEINRLREQLAVDPWLEKQKRALRQKLSNLPAEAREKFWLLLESPILAPTHPQWPAIHPNDPFLLLVTLSLAHVTNGNYAILPHWIEAAEALYKETESEKPHDEPPNSDTGLGPR